MAIKNRLTFFVLLMLLISKTSLAGDGQEFTVKNNDTVTAIISQRELSRFIFKNDRVKQIFAIEGELTYEINDENLYIRPNVMKPVNFFVNTNAGATYKIVVNGKDIPATQILINSKDDKSSLQINEEELSEGEICRYELSKIISAALTNDTNLEYTTQAMYGSKEDARGVRVKCVSKWFNEEFVAEKYFLHNQSTKELVLNNSDYLDQNSIAVFLDKKILLPKETTVLIIVRKMK